jgi:hypothetical protein
MVDVLADMGIKNISKPNNDKKLVLFYGKIMVCSS